MGWTRSRPRRESLGAVNTLVAAAGQLVGHNTDVAGFLAALESAGCAPRRALVLGAGGAARAAVFALLSRGVTVTVANRSPQRAQVWSRPWKRPPLRADTCSLEALALRDALSGPTCW